MHSYGDGGSDDAGDKEFDRQAYMTLQIDEALKHETDPERRAALEDTKKKLHAEQSHSKQQEMAGALAQGWNLPSGIEDENKSQGQLDLEEKLTNFFGSSWNLGYEDFRANGAGPLDGKTTVNNVFGLGVNLELTGYTERDIDYLRDQYGNLWYNQMQGIATPDGIVPSYMALQYGLLGADFDKAYRISRIQSGIDAQYPSAPQMAANYRSAKDWLAISKNLDAMLNPIVATAEAVNTAMLGIPFNLAQMIANGSQADSLGDLDPTDSLTRNAVASSSKGYPSGITHAEAQMLMNNPETETWYDHLVQAGMSDTWTWPIRGKIPVVFADNPERWEEIIGAWRATGYDVRGDWTLNGQNLYGETVIDTDPWTDRNPQHAYWQSLPEGMEWVVGTDHDLFEHMRTDESFNAIMQAAWRGEFIEENGKFNTTAYIQYVLGLGDPRLSNLEDTKPFEFAALHMALMGNRYRFDADSFVYSELNEVVESDLPFATFLTGAVEETRVYNFYHELKDEARGGLDLLTLGRAAYETTEKYLPGAWDTLANLWDASPWALSNPDEVMERLNSLQISDPSLYHSILDVASGLDPWELESFSNSIDNVLDNMSPYERKNQVWGYLDTYKDEIQADIWTTHRLGLPYPDGTRETLDSLMIQVEDDQLRQEIEFIADGLEGLELAYFTNQLSDILAGQTIPAYTPYPQLYPELADIVTEYGNYIGGDERGELAGLFSDLSSDLSQNPFTFFADEKAVMEYANEFASHRKPQLGDLLLAKIAGAALEVGFQAALHYSGLGFVATAIGIASTAAWGIHLADKALKGEDITVDLVDFTLEELILEPLFEGGLSIVTEILDLDPVYAGGYSGPLGGITTHPMFDQMMGSLTGQVWRGKTPAEFGQQIQSYLEMTKDGTLTVAQTIKANPAAFAMMPLWVFGFGMPLATIDSDKTPRQMDFGHEDPRWNEQPLLPGIDSPIIYSPLDKHERPTGVSANLTEPLPKGTEVETEDITGWPGFGQGYDRSHLIANSLGGSGSDKRNLVPLLRNVNQKIMKPYEMEVLRAVRSGQTVEYSVTPLYRDDELIPYAIEIKAQGSGEYPLLIEVTIPNE